MEGTDKIREAGLKLTPQRKAVYEAMTELRHAPIEENAIMTSRFIVTIICLTDSR